MRVAIACTLFALAACGGGGSAIPSEPAAPAPVPTATPTPNPHPASSGDTFSYAGTLSQTFTIYGTPAPQTSASPQPTATPWVDTSTTNVTQQTSVATGASFAGQSGLADFATTETDAGTRTTTTSQSHAYLAFVPDSSRVSGSNAALVGTTSTASNGVALQTVYTSPGEIVDELPEIPNSQWTNSAARTQSEKDPSGETLSSSYAADGSYTEQIAFPAGGTSTVQVNSDGSGDYQAPFIGENVNSAITVNPPAGNSITVVYAIYGVGLPQTGSFQVPLWYPSRPPVLASDTFADAGTATLPAACHVNGAYVPGGAVNEVVETRTRLDTIFGELENDRQTSYVASPYGVLCTIIHDDLKTYYDYSGQTDSVLFFEPSPVEDSVVDETLALQSAAIVSNPSSAARGTKAAVSSAVPVRAFASSANVSELFAAIHARHAHALLQRFHVRQPQ